MTRSIAKHLQEKIKKNRLETRHLGVSRAVVDVEDEVPGDGVPVRVARPDQVEVDEVQAQRPPELAGDPVHEVLGWHLGVAGGRGREEGDVGEGCWRRLPEWLRRRRSLNAR